MKPINHAEYQAILLKGHELKLLVDGRIKVYKRVGGEVKVKVIREEDYE